MGPQAPELKVRAGWIYPAVLLALLTLLPFLVPSSELFSVDVEPVPMQVSDPPLVPRLLFIIVDGLSADWAMKPGWMPRLQEKAALGASGVSMASFPTLTTPGLRALICGRRETPRPELPTGGVPVQRAFDSVLSRAASAGRRVFVSGQQDWQELFEGHGAKMTIVPYRGMPPGYDDKILEGALGVLRGRQGNWNFLGVHFFDSDLIGHLEGTQSAAYRAKLMWIDRKIAEMAALAGPDAIVIVTSDHGQTRGGAHGGTDAAVRRTPFVMWGSRVRRANLGVFSQVDVAATLSAILGVAFPSKSEGAPHLEGLLMKNTQRAEIQINLLEQRRRRWEALKTAWPWLRGNFESAVKEARGMARAGDYVRAADFAAAQVRRMDEVLGVVSPGRWIGRLLLCLWLLVLASAFGSVWMEASAGGRAVAALTAAVCVASLALPLALPGSWPQASAVAVACCALLTGLSLSAGHQSGGIGWWGWTLWLLSLAAVAFRDLVDPVIWAGFTCYFVWLALWRSHKEKEKWRLPMAMASLLALTVLSCWTPAVDMSVLRSLLPELDLRRLGFFDVRRAQTGFALTLGAVGMFKVWGRPGTLEKWTGVLLSWLPFAATLLMKDPRPERLALAWSLCGVFFVGVIALHEHAEVRGFWLTLVGLAFSQTLSTPIESCFLMLGILASWSAMGLGRPRGFWKGLWLVAVALWVYSEADGRIDFSHISVAETYSALGLGWHPVALNLLIASKHLLLIGLPMLPLLATESLTDTLSALPVIGAMSAGSFTTLWFDRYQQGLSGAMIINDPNFERMVWLSVFAWVPLLLWVLVRVPSLGELQDRLRLRARGSAAGAGAA